jgi:hypothetical protein
VIKATLESARAGIKPRTDNHLMAGPPQDLLEDLADRHRDVGAEHTAILKSPGSAAPPPMVQGVKALSTQMLQPQSIPFSSGSNTVAPGSVRPPPSSANQSGGYAAQYSGPVPSGSVSVPGVSMSASMPAHFMMAQAPYSDGRIDPPGTAVTSRTKIGGRPATSWALALAAFGLFVGVGAVAVMNGNDGFKDASASFVDPSRAGAKAAAAAPAAPTGVAVANEQPATVGVPPVAVPPAPPAAAPEAVAAPVVTTPPAAVAAAPAAPAAAPPAPAAVAVNTPPKPAAPAAVAPPRPAPAPAPPRPARPAPAPAPAAEETTAAAAPPAKPGKAGKGSAKGGGEMDDETKKALDELQKAQLERSF